MNDESGKRSRPKGSVGHNRRFFDRPCSALAAGLILLVFASCQFVGDDVHDGPGNGTGDLTTTAAGNGNQSYWQPEPVKLRVFPSTRFINESGSPILEARIELLDEMQHSIKSGGDLRIELYRGDITRDGRVGDRLYAWDIPLVTLEDQRNYYDAITRAYLFRLKVDNLQVARKTNTLRVTFKKPGGSRLEVQKVMTSGRATRLGS